MKVVLVWDPRFLAQKAARLMLDDRLASAAVRAGVAAAVDPAEQADLAAGAPLDPGSLTDAIVQHGPAKRPVRVVLPASVIAVGVALGIAAAASGPPIPGDTAPVFTAAPAIAPASGTSSTTFTATDGTVSNGSVTGRRWLLNGTAIGTGTTVVPGSTGSLVLENTATGPGGTTTATSSAVTVSAVTAPSFTAAPSISPSSGNSAATFTATDGTVSNGSVTARRWLLSGTAIGTGVTVVPGAAGSLVLENTATGPGGTTTATSSAVTVTAAAQFVTSINAEGWSGEATNPGALPAMTYSLPSELAPDTAPITMPVIRAGFDATAAATSYGELRIFTKRKRQTWSAGLPDTNHPPATAATVAMDDYVYATDTIAGVTNNSTEISPKPIAAWVMPARLLVANTITWEIIAFHRDYRDNRQVAAIRVRANDGTTQTSWQVVATAQPSAGLVEDAQALEVYTGSLDITALATGPVWLEAEVYPWIGADNADHSLSSVLRSEDNWATGLSARTFTRRYYRKDVSRQAAPPLAYVASTGSDTTGVWSTNATTAAATPFLTLTGAHKALAGAAATGGIADGCRIRIVDSVAVALNTVAANTCGGAGLIIERAPTSARASAYVTMANNYITAMSCSVTGLEGCIIFNDLTLERTVNSGSMRGSGATTQQQVHFVHWNTTLKDATASSTAYTNGHSSYFGVTFDAATTNFGWITNGTPEVRIMRGVKGDVNNNVNVINYIQCGNNLKRRNGGFMQAPVNQGCIFYNSVELSCNGTSSPISVGGLAIGDTIVGIAIVQNLIEVTGTGTNNIIGVSRDNGNASTTHSVIINNTLTGAKDSRGNFFYDESTGTTRRQHKLMRMCGNIHVQVNTKGDVHVAVAQSNPTEAPNRTGHFAYMHGVGVQGEFVVYCSADGGQVGSPFSQMYAGVGSSVGTSQTTRNDPLFVNYQAATQGPVAGAGGGDYHLQSGSPARNRVTARGLRYDLGGAMRPTSGSDASGAYA